MTDKTKQRDDGGAASDKTLRDYFAANAELYEDDIDDACFLMFQKTNAGCEIFQRVQAEALARGMKADAMLAERGKR